MCVLDVEVPGASGVKGVLVHGVRCVTGVDVVVNPLSSEVVGGKVDGDRVPCSEQLVGRVSSDCITCVRC